MEETAEQASIAETMECVICFEPINESTVLPCDCKVPYCLRCWDRSLAASFNAGTGARCPTCRTPVRVDFDANECRLKFSRETEDEETSDHDTDADDLERLREDMRQAQNGEASQEQMRELAERFMALHEAHMSSQVTAEQRRNETIERLATQAIPAMTRILEQYRSNNDAAIQSYLQDPDEALGTLPEDDVRKQIVAMGGSKDSAEGSDAIKTYRGMANSGTVASFLSSAVLGAPPCVCGNSLERFDIKERCRSFLQQNHVPEDELESVLDDFVTRGQSNMICDLCDGPIPFDTFVWTCRSKDSTILHATTYDVCDDCFVRCVCSSSPCPTYGYSSSTGITVDL